MVILVFYERINICLQKYTLPNPGPTPFSTLKMSRVNGPFARVQGSSSLQCLCISTEQWKL